MLHHAGPKVALVQRSCGYALRPTLTVADIEDIVRVVKAAAAECIVVVDNCYGEFTEGSEPGAVSSSSACCSTQYPLFVKTRSICFLSRQEKRSSSHNR